jgi:hypothetical protein
VGVQTGKTHRPSEISSATLFDRAFCVVIKMLLCKAKINDIDFLETLAENEIGGFDVSVDVVAIVDFFNSFEHFNQ